MISALLILIGAFSYCFIRGGWWKTLFSKFYANHPDIISGDYPNAIIYGATAGYFSHNWYLGIALTCAMFFGAMFGIFNDLTDTAFNNKKVFEWVWRVTLRGFEFCTATALCVEIIYPEKGLYFLLPALIMPLAYSYIWWVTPTTKPINSWTLSEMTYGAILFLPLLSLLH